MPVGTPLFSARKLLVVLTSLVTVTVIILAQGAFSTSFGSNAQGVSIKLKSAEYVPLSGGEGNQVKLNVDYLVNDPTLINKKINSVMKVYLTNGTLAKTSSSSAGFVANQSGSQRHATTISNSSVHEVIAVVQFTDLAKTVALSNPLQENLTLAKSQPKPEAKHEIAPLP